MLLRSVTLLGFRPCARLTAPVHWNACGEAPETGGRPADGAVQKNEPYRLPPNWSRVSTLSQRPFLIFARLCAFQDLHPAPRRDENKNGRGPH